MLKFTPEQEAVVLNQRRAFNTHQAALANSAGQTMIGNAYPVPKDVWGMWDREGVEVQRSVLAVFNDLASSVSMPMPIGKLVHHFQTISDSGSVNISIDGRSEARTDQPVFDYHGTPLPIIDSAFGFGWRQMEAARSEGFTLDPAAARNSMRKVAEKLEDIVLNGDSKIAVDGTPLYGLRNHPRRNTDTHGYDLTTATGPEVLTAINKALLKLHADNFREPATVYMNWDDWFRISQTDYSTAYPNVTILQRVLQNGGIREIIPASSVPADNIIAVVKNRSVLQVLSGMPMNTIAKFRANVHDDYNFVTMAAASLEIKYDANGQCGIAHVTAA